METDSLEHTHPILRALRNTLNTDDDIRRISSVSKSSQAANVTLKEGARRHGMENTYYIQLKPKKRGKDKGHAHELFLISV